MTTAPMKLYTWWRSQASFRVRIALHLKGLKAEMSFIDLSKDDQLAAPYQLINPEMVLPTLIDGEGPPLTQSLQSLSISRSSTQSARSCRRKHVRARMCAHLRRW